MRILLTGAGGQLGTALRACLDPSQVVALGHGELDIADFAAVRAAVAAHAPDVVVNAAAYNKVDAAETDPEAAFRGNAVGPRNLALASAERGAAVLHVSTDYVFDGRGQRPYHEYDATGPRSAYGRSKLAGEEAVRAVNPRHYVVRTAWVYHHTHAGNFPQTMLRLARDGAVRVVSDQFGSPTYAPHLARALAALLDTGAWGTYHFAGAGEASWFELTRELFARMGVAADVTPVSTAAFPRPAERPRYAVLATIQEPRIVLPDWREGVAAFAAALR